jgi:hypothetical protein
MNDSGRRFCIKCGRQLVASTAGHQPPPTRKSAVQGWWQGVGNAKDRAARRAYRQSLPAFYRWRRVAVSLLCVGAVGGLLWGTGFRPIAYALDRYWEGRNNWLTFVTYRATIVPPEAAGAGGVKALSDDSEEPWTTPWTVDTPVAQCGAATGSPELVLTWDEARSVQRLEIWAGAADPDVRPTQFRPTVIVITGEDGSCLAEQAVSEEPKETVVDLPGAPEQRSLRIGFAAVAAPGEGGEEALSVTEIRVLARPF